jgi:tRNA-specific 2-thiouridylase
MSGGVDSSVAAALLKERGHDVVGVTLLTSPSAEAGARDAENAARALGIPHRVLDVSEKFEEHVVSYFCAEYSAGRTPNPCVVCNRRIKFGELLQAARAMGAAALATGHYARTTRSATGDGRDGGRYLLLKGSDRDKDQSYALYSLDQEQLAAALFPVGGMTKKAVRETARRLGLPVADKPESQEICFIPSGDYRDFLRRRCPGGDTPGPILDTSGRVLGTHDGLWSYTVGQRRGLGIASREPLYVVRIDRPRNALIVGTAAEASRRECRVAQVNFIPFDRLAGPMEVGCKVRYRAEETPAVIRPGPDSTVHVMFSRPERAVTPGQSAVFYDGDVVVGGGVIL